ncbi:MAG: hypothetical protein Pars93KO_28580 [Parasphingorhabdus sp.]
MKDNKQKILIYLKPAGGSSTGSFGMAIDVNIRSDPVVFGKEELVLWTESAGITEFN